MRIRRNHQWIGMGLILLFLIVGSASAQVEVSKKAEIRADQDEIDAILYTFDQAEEALQAKNLSVIMTIYSDGYQNRGLRKGDTSRIWQDLFNRYDRLSSHHHFSRIVVDPDGTKAKVTCTGALLGVSVFKKETVRSRCKSIPGSRQTTIWCWKRGRGGLSGMIRRKRSGTSSDRRFTYCSERRERMQLPLKITDRSMNLSEAAREDIREKAEHLNKYYDRIIRCEVTVDAPHRHQLKGLPYDVRINITIPEAEFIIKRESNEDLYVVIRDAFDAARRRLEEVARRKRGRSKGMNRP
ncbi:MAG: HPF/RaiA family ribosome-associated protein [Candidatus Manganitrophus sp.]|nr:MAG: HPF/RaiA family ribosome-associated protein [Candidatus Manganitrophus sp.]